MQVMVLDVNETLSDMTALAPRMADVGASGDLLATWFASALRDGFAVTAAGGYAEFATVARAALHTLFAALPSLDRDPGEAARHVLAGMPELPLHADVPPGLERLHRAGIRLVTLTNGSAATVRELLHRGGVAEYVEQYLSVEDTRRWKPAPEPYRFAADRCGIRPHEMMLAAVHPWDVDGAKRAGLSAAWINRDGARYPEVFTQPDLTCSGFEELADLLAVDPAEHG